MKHQKIHAIHRHVVLMLNAETEYVLVILNIMGTLTLVVTQNVWPIQTVQWTRRASEINALIHALEYVL